MERIQDDREAIGRMEYEGRLVKNEDERENLEEDSE